MQSHRVYYVLHKSCPGNLRLRMEIFLYGRSFCMYGNPICRVVVYTGSSYLRVSLTCKVIFYVFSQHFFLWRNKPSGKGLLIMEDS
jgi:hypothetical protein